MNKRNLDFAYKIAFQSIKIVHDGALIRSLVKPDKILSSLGLNKGDTVFEPGCGPGFFTIGAARATGNKGHVYAYDVNPYAIRYLQKKLDRQNVKNVTAEERNAASTNLPGQSIDFAFITGIPRAVGGFDKLMDEVSRLLKLGGILAYRSHGGDKKQFTEKEIKTWLLTPVPAMDSNRFKIFKKR